MTSGVREPRIVSWPCFSPAVPRAAGSGATRKPLAIAGAPDVLGARAPAADLIACAARSARRVVHRGSVPRHLLLTRANQVQVLPDVDAAYRAVGEVIRRAEHEVLMQNYVWEDHTRGADNVMLAIRDRCDDVARGIRGPWQLRIVIHHRGRHALPTASHFSSDGLECFIRTLNPAHVHAELAYAHNHAFGADILHSKNVIVDGREVLFLGTNFDKHNDAPDCWYDNGLHLWGAPARAARADWCNVRSRRHTRMRACNVRRPWPPVAPPVPPEGLQAPVLVVSHLARRWPLRSRHCEANPQDQSVLALLRNASVSIDIITPCLNVPSVRHAIVNAVLRGVVVRYVTCLNMDKAQQHWFRGGDNADSAHKLLRAILKRGGPAAARRLHIAWSSFDGMTRPPQKTHGTSHAKNMCVDGRVLMVGSMNLDWQSWNNSRELSCIVDDSAVAATWQQDVFAKRWAAAVPIAPRDLPWWHRHGLNRAYRWLQKK